MLYADFGRAFVMVSHRILTASCGTTSRVVSSFGLSIQENHGILEWVHRSGSGSHNIFSTIRPPG